MIYPSLQTSQTTADDHYTEVWDVEKARRLILGICSPNETWPDKSRQDKVRYISLHFLSLFTLSAVSSRQILFHLFHIYIYIVAYIYIIYIYIVAYNIYYVYTCIYRLPFVVDCSIHSPHAYSPKLLNLKSYIHVRMYLN